MTDVIQQRYTDVISRSIVEHQLFPVKSFVTLPTCLFVFNKKT